MSGFSVRVEPIEPGATKTLVEQGGRALTMRQAFALMAGDAAFRSLLVEQLRSAPFAGYFWETPPTTVTTCDDQPFEFVVIDAPTLQRVAAEPEAFREHFARDSGEDGVVTFENLGRDATLVVPTPEDALEKYAHLAAFVRAAPPRQIDALFRRVGAACAARLSEHPQWLSTASLGVYWLHVRIDSRPKYYRHVPYTAAPSGA
jgi:hypothetical protein